MISIVIPVYNGADRVGRALESLKCKDQDSYEVILVNDASTDNTAEVAKQHLSAFKNHKLVNLEERVKVTEVRYRGLLETREDTDYILFMDHDDELGKGSLEAILKHEKEWKEDLVVGQINQMVELAGGGHRDWTKIGLYPRMAEHSLLKNIGEISSATPTECSSSSSSLS